MSPPADLGSGESDRVLDALSASIARRLRNACDEMNSVEFDALVLKIARFKIRWGETAAPDNLAAITGEPPGKRPGKR